MHLASIRPLSPFLSKSHNNPPLLVFPGFFKHLLYNESDILHNFEMQKYLNVQTLNTHFVQVKRIVERAEEYN